jgi:O-antigen ligase
MFGNRITTSLVAFAMVGAPFLFGSTEPVVIAFWCVILGAGLLFCDIRSLRPSHYALLGGVAIAVAAYMFVLHEQLAFMPWIAKPNPLWSEVAEILVEPLRPSAAIAWNQPWFSIGSPLIVLLALTSGIIVGADRVLAWRLFRIAAWSGAAYALYALAAFLIEPTKVLWREKQAHEHVLTGTFVNRNTAAAFFGACSILWILLLLEELRKLVRRDQSRLSEAIRSMLSERSRSFAASIVMLLLCLAAMFLTASRAGVVLSLGTLLIAVSFSLGRMLQARANIFIMILVMAGCLVVLTQVMAPGLSGRVEVEGVSDEGRFATYRSTLNMIANQPWWGTGLGTFEVAYPAYRSGEISMWGTWNRAHNTLLEIASDLGLPIAVLVAAGWMLIILILFRGSLRRSRDVALPIAGLAIALLGVTHSLVDFSLQIPGFAVICCVIVGVGLSQSIPAVGRKISHS